MKKTMTKAQKRVAIAKDVIAQVKLEKMIPKQGCYFVAQSRLRSQDIDQKIATKARFKCKVCATGAAMISYIRKFNELKTNDYNASSDEIVRVAGSVFSITQLGLMEAAFERETLGGHFRRAVSPKAVKFFDNYPIQSERLLAIFRNIIANKGTFRP